MFFDVYKKLCEEHNVTCSRAAQEMGINKGTVSVWKKKGTSPQAAQLQKIAEYFGVSADYLLSMDKKENAPGITAESLTDEEQELISIWRSVMSPEERTKQLAAWKARAGQQ